MRRLMLGLVSWLALTCQAQAQDPSAHPAGTGKPADIPATVAPRAALAQPPAAPVVRVALAPAPSASGAAVVAAVAASAPAVSAPSCPHQSYSEGQKVELAGALFSTRDGRIVLKTETGEIFILLENQNLWRMEQRAAFGEREFRVRGQVSKYQERYYLAVGKILETAVKLKHEKAEDDDEHPFWERLMFWKNS